MLDLVLLYGWRTAVTITLMAYLAVDLWRLSRFGPAFAIQELTLGNGDAAQPLLLMRGRPTGLVELVCALLGLSADLRLEVTSTEFRVDRMSLKGFDTTYAPMHDLSSSRCGYYRAISLLLIALSLAFSAILQLLTAWGTVPPYQRLDALADAGPSAMVAATAAAVAYGFYELSKRMVVSVDAGGSKLALVAFKRNVVENVTIGMEQALDAVAVLNDAILKAAPPNTGSLAPFPGGVR